METFFTPSNIMFTLGVLGAIFSVYAYFRNPQVESDKRDALVALQLKTFMDATADRFKEMQGNFNQLLLQSANHIHTVDTKVETLATNMNVMSNEITKLGTIIEERFPKK